MNENSMFVYYVFIAMSATSMFAIGHNFKSPQFWFTMFSVIMSIGCWNVN